jgi:hypothetical protein
MANARIRKTGVRQRGNPLRNFITALWHLILRILGLLACLTLIPEIIWLYIFFRHKWLYKSFESVRKRLEFVAQNCPSPVSLDIVESYYLKLLNLLQANNLLRGVVDLRLGTTRNGGRGDQVNLPCLEDIEKCIVDYKGSYAYPTKLECPPKGISYPSDLLRSALELRDDEFETFRAVTRLAEIIKGISKFPRLNNKAVDTALREIVSRDEYYYEHPTLQNRLLFETEYFVPYGFYEYPTITGYLKGFILRPLRERPYATASFFKARKQLKYWKHCLKMMETLGDLSEAPEIFWKKPAWMHLRMDPVWEDSLAKLAYWFCFEKAKSTFFRDLRELILSPGGEERISFLFSHSLTDIQDVINKVPGYALNAVELVRLSKKLWRCSENIRRHRGRELTFVQKQLLRLSGVRMGSLRRTCVRMAS